MIVFYFFKPLKVRRMLWKNILDTYEEALGQAINLLKLNLFCSRNTSDELKNLIATTLDVSHVLGTGKHATFKFIKKRIWSKICYWSSSWRKIHFQNIINATDKTTQFSLSMPPYEWTWSEIELLHLVL